MKASDRQLDYIRDLMERRGLDESDIGRKLGDLTMREASELIEELKND